MSAKTTKRVARDAPRVLVVYKKSAYQVYVKERRNARFIELLERKDPSVARLIEAHEDHVETIEEAREALELLGARASFRFRGDDGLVDEVDLVVTIGGDGTLLWASKWIGAGTPVLAINSAPRDSVGHFCGGQKGSVRQILGAAIAGELRESKLTRMEVELEGEVLTRRVLNDALFTHASPAATTRYILRHVGEDGRALQEEEHKSSGMWIGPSAGSTAAQLSAGGKVLPVGSRRIQFVVREPYIPPGGPYQMIRGLIDPGQELRVISKVRDGRVFVDGPHLQREVRMGGELVFRKSEETLSLLAFPRAED